MIRSCDVDCRKAERADATMLQAMSRLLSSSIPPPASLAVAGFLAQVEARSDFFDLEDLLGEAKDLHTSFASHANAVESGHGYESIQSELTDARMHLQSGTFTLRLARANLILILYQILADLFDRFLILSISLYQAWLSLFRRISATCNGCETMRDTFGFKTPKALSAGLRDATNA